MNAPEPATILESEALRKSVTITWRDMKFELPPADDWGAQFFSLYERDKPTLAIEAILGPQQYERWLAAGPKLSEIGSFLTTALSAAGLAPGESAASTA